MAPETGCAGTQAVCRADVQARRTGCPELSHLAAGGPAAGQSLGLPHRAAVRLSDGNGTRAPALSVSQLSGSPFEVSGKVVSLELREGRGRGFPGGGKKARG